MSKRRKDRLFERVLFIPDTHVPHHHQGAWELTLEIARQFEWQILCILGDFGNLDSVSYYSKKPDDCPLLMEEIAHIKLRKEEIEEAAGARRKIYIEGNHEERLSRYIKDKASALWGVTSLPQLLELKGWEFYPYGDVAKIGRHLLVSHDFGSGSQNAHVRALDKAGMGRSVCHGHTHRSNVENRVTLDGELIQAAVFGWLGDPGYIKYRNRATLNCWPHGVGIGYLWGRDRCLLQPVPYFDNSTTAIVEGQWITTKGGRK